MYYLFILNNHEKKRKSTFYSDNLEMKLMR